MRRTTYVRQTDRRYYLVIPSHLGLEQVEYKLVLKDATNWKGSSARYGLLGAMTVTPGVLWMAGVADASMLAALF